MSAVMEQDRAVEAILAAYDAGEKVSSIVARLNVPKATVMFVLEQHGKLAKRHRRADTLVGNQQQMAHLYDTIVRQAEWIAQAWAVLQLHDDLGVPAPPVQEWVTMPSTSEAPLEERRPEGGATSLGSASAADGRRRKRQG